MKRLYTLPLLLACGVFSLISSQEARADCVLSTGPGQINLTSIYHLDRFGVWVNAFAKTATDECEDKQTEWTDSITSEIATQGFIANPQEQTDAYNNPIKATSLAEAAISNLTTTVSIDYENYGADGSVLSKLVDFVVIEKSNANPNELTLLPFTFCSTKTSTAVLENQNGAPPITGSNQSTISYGDFHYGGEHKAFDKLTFDDGAPGKIIHPNDPSVPDEICRTGVLTMSGKFVAFSLGLSTTTIGDAGNKGALYGPGNIVYVPHRQANMSARIEFDPFPQDVSCYSASGDFPQCDPCREDHANVQGFDTVTLAARDASINALTEPDVDTYEYGGNIYPQCNTAPQKYAYTYSKLGLGDGDIDATGSAVAGWHTHEDNDPFAQLFSPEDVNWVSQNLMELYMAEQWNSTFWVLYPVPPICPTCGQFLEDFVP